MQAKKLSTYTIFLFLSRRSNAASHNAVSNRLYLGTVIYNDEVFDGEHEPIIETFVRVPPAPRRYAVPFDNSPRTALGLVHHRGG